jgi:YfiH family protein
MKQVHGVRAIDAGNAAPDTEADGAVAGAEKAVCAVLTADCLPVLLCDRAGTAVGIAHAGWRGLAAGIVEKVVGAMRVPARSLMAYLGPGIGPGAYEVGEDVRSAFVSADPAAAGAFAPLKEGKFLADLYALARRRLASAGVGDIRGGGYCTLGEERFFSFRRDGITGRMASLIWLEDD